jgi:hypothetical protein
MRYEAAVLILIGTGSIASAQGISAAGTQAQTSHRLLGDPRGVVAGASLAWTPVFAWRVTYSHLGHDQTRAGRACAGLLPPDPALCPVESIEDAVTMRGVALGLAATVARRGNLALAVIPSAGVFRVRSMSEGHQTGNQLSAAKLMIGFGVGAELSIVPHPPWPVTLHVGTHAGIMAGPDEEVADGYTPFNDAIRVARVELGLTVRRRRTPSQ